MSEQRLIDANALLDKQESLYMKGNVLFHGIAAFAVENAPAIDPETLPIVRELREKLKQTDQELRNVKYCYDIAKNGERQLRRQVNEVTAEWAECVKNLKQVTAQYNAAIGELNGVLDSVDALTEFVDDEVHPVVDYDLYLRLRDKVDVITQWEHADEWGVGGDHP